MIWDIENIEICNGSKLSIYLALCSNMFLVRLIA
jgi:hypothetical protein